MSRLLDKNDHRIKSFHVFVEIIPYSSYSPLLSCVHPSSHQKLFSSQVLEYHRSPPSLLPHVFSHSQEQQSLQGLEQCP